MKFGLTDRLLGSAEKMSRGPVILWLLGELWWLCLSKCLTCHAGGGLCTLRWGSLAGGTRSPPRSRPRPHPHPEVSSLDGLSSCCHTKFYPEAALGVSGQDHLCPYQK